MNAMQNNARRRPSGLCFLAPLASQRVGRGDTKLALESVRGNSVLIRVAPAFRRASSLGANARLKAGATEGEPVLSSDTNY